jgi:hypothetical protein
MHNKECVIEMLKTPGINNNIENATGPRLKAFRQRLMLAITGQLLPVGKCGVNACREALVEGFGIDKAGKCLAQIEKELCAKVRGDS